MPYNTKKINIAYKSKNNLPQKRQIILLMISDGQKWHYLVVKNLSRLLRGITSNHKEDFYCLNCFHSYRTENKLEAHKKICENHDYCHVEMPTKNNNIIKYNHGEESIKLPFVIYADLECFLEKISTCIITLMSHLLLKQISIHHRVIQYLLIVHSINQKTNLIIIEVKIV